jgi:hypothetical protein
MTLKKIGSKSYVVNLLSDYILSEISTEENSIIKVIDCGNFFVIKGKTTSKEVLFLPNIISKFNERFEIPSKLTHTIDLIEYDSDLPDVKSISHTYHSNTSNCSYNQTEIEKNEISEETDELVYVSSFPHGYSLTQGRLLYYYGKKIFYNIPSNYLVTSLEFHLTNERNDENEFGFSVYDGFYKTKDEVLRSAVLDIFDFNMEPIAKEIKKVDWSIELTDPLYEYDFLKEKVEGFIII